ncbi:MAG: cytochrome c, partial [Pseudomonadales bacterium]|nr:cytochrome c [Pseudomonadales bacterium]
MPPHAFEPGLPSRPELRWLALGLSTAVCMMLSDPGLAAPRVDNFLLLDHRGNAQELYYQTDVAAVMIMAHSSRCAAADSSAYQRLAADWADRSVRFFMLNADPADNRAVLTNAAGDSSIPILEDDAQIIARGLDFKQAGETVIVDTADWSLVYRGPLDQSTASLETLLADARPAGATDKPIELSVAGCPIAYRSPAAGAEVSYSTTIAPLLKENCAYCHVEGGIAPWAMTGYTMVRGFAPMIREVIRTRRMPPWHADPHIGQWQGDRSLTAEETRTLVHWIDAGAPRGEGPDPLEGLAPLNDAWPLGKPDLVVEIPGFEVPASGVVDYQFPYVKNTLEKGVWIRAATVLPGERSVVHHVLAGSIEGDIPPGDEDSVMDNYIMGYAPGADTYVMPEGTGVYIAPGGFFSFQLHYTPNGRAVVDESKMGLYLSEQPPRNYLRNTVIVSPLISIPPNAPDHAEAAYYEFNGDVVIHTLFPHAHYRGRSSTFEVRYPDGRLETLLSVPNYDFNWQRGYN